MISKKSKGSLSIKAKSINREFTLYYFFRNGETHLNFADSKTYLTLVRINIDEKFHKNSDGIIRGNRIEIFSEDEFKAKGDGRTSYKAYSLPFEKIENTNDFFTIFENLLEYTHTQKNGMLFINTSLSAY
ncbi:hypothetical protein EJK20_04780 [Lactobacillus xujianguonis]|nr:hypothetical protein [Lactobacillus xujianguonis]RVU74120.1 hypothetical protein EJK20_04780 [Lactobacillus xujianguonis]